MLFIRGAGPIGYPGGAEVVNMQPPDALLKRGINELPCIGDGRQSGTSGSPSILNASPEAAAGGGLALVRTGDRIRIDLEQARGEHPDLRTRSSRSAAPRCEPSSAMAGCPTCRTARRRGRRSSAGMVDQFDEGMVLKPAVKYRDVAHHKYPARQSLRGRAGRRRHAVRGHQFCG